MFLRYLLPILVMLSSSLAYADTREHFNQLLAEIWAFELTADPVRAGRLGHHEFLDKLPDISAQGLKKHYQTRLTYLAQLEDVEQKNLNRSEQITWSIQHRELRNQIDLYRFNAHYMPINSEYGFHLQLSSMARSTQLKTKQQQQAYLARVKAITPYIQQQIAWMSKGIEQGYMLPKAAMVGFGDSIKSLITSSAIDNVFYTPAKKPNTTLSAEYQQQLQAEITNRLLPALVQLNTFYHEKYQVAMLQPVGIDAIPQGKEFYQNRVAHYTTTQKTADEIHQVGLAEVSRIRSQMQGIIQSLEFDGEIPDFIHFLRTDPQFYATSVKQLIQYASYLSKKMDAKLPALFHPSELPRTPYGVAPVPANIAPKYTTGRYISPANDKQPGLYWVNTYALDKRPLYALPALTLHEAVPGHHLQISLAREMASLPPIRRYTYLSAFGEGWGLYSEFLGKEVGMYDDPYDDFGRLSYEMWRACRLVIDTGLHSKGWSRQRAIDYMSANTALSSHNVRTEIDRYITWPAQALSYKLGEIVIRSLRKKAEAVQGDNFDVRDFHREILKHGSVPLEVLEQNVDQYLKQQ